MTVFHKGLKAELTKVNPKLIQDILIVKKPTRCFYKLCQYLCKIIQLFRMSNEHCRQFAEFEDVRSIDLSNKLQFSFWGEIVIYLTRNSRVCMEIQDFRQRLDRDHYDRGRMKTIIQDFRSDREINSKEHRQLFKIVSKTLGYAQVSHPFLINGIVRTNKISLINRTRVSAACMIGLILNLSQEVRIQALRESTSSLRKVNMSQQCQKRKPA